MYYGQLIKECVTDGPGVRVSLYVSGCRNYCEGCHNPESWNFKFGKEYNNDTIIEILEALAKPYISGITYCGGDPMELENQRELLILSKIIRNTYGNDKSIWLYTGYEWETVKNSELIKYCDVAVTGPFILAKRDISPNNPWRGSTNQELIDVKKSLTMNIKINLSL